MLIKQLVRSHYELSGDFMSFPFMDELTVAAQKQNVSDPRELYFQLLGYKADGTLTSYERYKYRKLHAKGDIKALTTNLKLSNKSEIVEVLRQLECLSEKGKVGPVKEVDPSNERLARILSEYLVNNEEKLLWSKDKSQLFSTYYSRMRFTKSRKDLESILQSKQFLSATQIALPQVVYKKNCSPVISQGMFFVPYKLSPDKLNEIIQLAILQGLVRKLDVPETVYFYLVQNALNYPFVKDTEYLRLLDWSHSLRMTVSEMFSKCGLKFVDRVKYYTEFRVLPFLISNDKYLIFSSASDEQSKHVILNTNQLVSFVRTDVLRTLSWEGPHPFIYYNERQYLKDIFKAAATHDFSGGI